MREKITVINDLQALGDALEKWCSFLSQSGYDNFSESFKNSLASLNQAFNGGSKERYEGLLNFQDKFQGGMGSINDLSIDDGNLRKAVESEKEILLDRYHNILFPNK